MSRCAAPEMSVVIVTPDHFGTIHRTMGHLRAQTACGRLEIVIVAPSRDALGLDAVEMTGFGAYQVVEAGEVRLLARARAAGVRAAAAPVVAFAEDHAYPEPDWAEALLAAHDAAGTARAAVGPVVRNANPGTAVSWADLLIGYGPWLEPQEAGPRDFLPGHNSSYKRDLLLAYGPGLEGMLEADTILQWDLRARGHELYLEPRARLNHTNFALWSSWRTVQVCAGRVFAAARAQNERWPARRRLLFVGGSPLIPLVRLRRIAGHYRALGPMAGGRLPRGVFPALVAGLALDAWGQMLGYAFGAGDAEQKLCAFEFHRDRHVPARDRRAMVAPRSAEQGAS